MAVYSSSKALIVGVSRYADPQYDLSYARSDAEAMAELLGNEFGFDQVWTLYDTDATRQSITRFFEQDLQRTDEDDGLLIFFAGHGITVTSAIGDDRGFLVPHDGDPKQPYANLSLTTIRDDYMPMIPAKHVFLIVDSCYGGLALRDVATVERPKSSDAAVLSELTRRDRKVRQVLAAGTKDQRVLDGGLFGHSVFTGRLIEALREANPYITADHVGVHVRDRVARDAMDRKHRQTPQFGYMIGGEGSFVFLRTTETSLDKSIPSRHGGAVNSHVLQASRKEDVFDDLDELAVSLRAEKVSELILRPGDEWFRGKSRSARRLTGFWLQMEPVLRTEIFKRFPVTYRPWRFWMRVICGGPVLNVTLLKSNVDMGRAEERSKGSSLPMLLSIALELDIPGKGVVWRGMLESVRALI